MKKNKKILSSLILALTLLLSGCGENTADPNKEPKRTSNADGTQAAFKTENTETSDENVIQTEQENTSPDESMFAYYDLLNEEYEKYGVTTPKSLNSIPYNSTKNTIIYYSGNGELLFYNINDKTKKSISTDSTKDIRSGWIFCNNRLYGAKVKYTPPGESWKSAWDKMVHVRNYDGTFINAKDIDTNEEPDSVFEAFHFIGKSELWDSLESVNAFLSQPDGTVFLRCKKEYSFDMITLMVSPDYKTLTELPDPEIKEEHGSTKVTDYFPIACHNNKLFVISNSNNPDFFCIDTKTMTSEQLDLDLSDEIHFKGMFEYGAKTYNDVFGVSIRTSSLKSIGRYLLFEHTIFDMETNEVLMHNENFPGSFAGSYFGGKYNVVKSGGKWCFCKCPSDGSAVYLNDVESYEIKEEDPDKSCTPITDKYYIYEDKFGFFLRTYEKGAEEEETIILKSVMEEAMENN